MPPSAAKLEAALVEGTSDIYKTDPEAVSVNKVRRHVEEKFDLEEGFFTSNEWKDKSKKIIKAEVDKLLEAEQSEADSEPAKKPTPKSKRQSLESKTPQPKRPKQSSKTKEQDVVDEASEQEATSAQKKVAVRQKPKNAKLDQDTSKNDGTKAKRKKAGARRKSKTAESEEDDAGEEEDEAAEDFKASPSPPKKRKRDPKGETKKKAKPDDLIVDSDEEAEDAPVQDGNGTPKDDKSEPTQKSKEEGTEAEPSPSKDEEPKPDVVDEEDEYSDVIDVPPTKRSKKDKNAPAKQPKAAKKASKKSSVPVPEDPKEAEIKKLQSQLTKCGIRKLWHNELKQYGTDAKSKIRHLKQMLSDVGMDGRFSEAKAQEIKEMRELRADVEAAQEMNALWGMNSGGRASRSKSKSAVAEKKLESDHEDENEEEDEDEEGEPTSYAARRRKAHADLAFLGDDSDSN